MDPFKSFSEPVSSAGAVRSTQIANAQASLDNNFFFGAASAPVQKSHLINSDPFVGIAAPSPNVGFSVSTGRNVGAAASQSAPQGLSVGYVEDPFAALLAPVSAAPPEIPIGAPPPVPLYNAPAPSQTWGKPNTPPVPLKEMRQSNPFLDDDDAISAPPASADDLWGVASVPQQQAPVADMWGSAPTSNAPNPTQTVPIFPVAPVNSSSFDVFSPAPLAQTPAVPTPRTSVQPAPFVGSAAAPDTAYAPSQHSMGDLDLFSPAAFSDPARPVVAASDDPFAAPPPVRVAHVAAAVMGPPRSMPAQPFASVPAPASADPFSVFATQAPAPRVALVAGPTGAPIVDPFSGAPTAAAIAPMAASPAPSANPFNGDDDPFGVFSPGKPVAAPAQAPSANPYVGNDDPFGGFPPSKPVGAPAPSRAVPIPATTARPQVSISSAPVTADPFASFPSGNKGAASSDPFGGFPATSKPVESDDPFGVFTNTSKPAASASFDFFSPGGASAPSTEDTDDAMKRFRDAYGGPVAADADVDERTHPQKGSSMPKGGRYASQAETHKTEEINLPTQGYILSRMSTRSLFSKDWAESYWVIVGNHLLLYRNKQDYEYNPGGTRVKKDVAITHKLRCQKVHQKEYEGYGMLYNFMLEEMEDYGPANVAKFASRDRNPVDELYVQLTTRINKAKQALRGGGIP